MEQEQLEGMPVRLSARQATLGDLAKLLGEQQAVKLDVVAPAGAIRSENGVIRLLGTEADIDLERGITATEGSYRPTVVADEGIAEKLGIPMQYLKRLRVERPDLYDKNVNGWLHGCTSTNFADGTRVEYGIEGDPRKFLVRNFRGLDGGEGVCRAFLSQNFKMIDNLDVLTAALDGVRASGMAVEIDGCDLTERRMHVRLVAPEVSALAPVLLKNYRSPFGDRRPWETPEGRRHGWIPEDDRPVVFAGFVLTNSETGGGAFTIAPRLMIKVCLNGLVITADALRSVHLGGKMDEGIVKWSDETLTKNLELVTAQAKDAVATFLDVDYVTRKVEELEAKSQREIARPKDAIETIGKQLRFSQETIEGVLDHFIRGGDVTAGGVLNAVTSYAQTMQDADDAYEMESIALRAFDLAAAN